MTRYRWWSGLTRILPLLFLLCLCLPSRPIHAAETLRVGVHQNAPSVFITEEGEVSGFYVDILNEIAKQAGWYLDFVEGTWPEGLQRLKTGEIDLLVAVAYTPERAQHYAFTQEPVFSNWGQLYVQDARIASILDLRNRTIAGMKDDIYTLEFKKLLDDFGIFYVFLETESYDAAMEHVVQGRANAAIISRATGLRVEESFDLNRSQIICCAMKVHYAVSKTAEPAILEILDRHLKLLKRDKSSFYYQTFDQWFGRKDSPDLPAWAFSAFLAVLLGGVLLFLLVNQGVLRRRVREREDALQRERGKRKAVESRLRLANPIRTHTSDAVFVTDETFHIVEVNPAFEKITGFSQKAMQGHKAFWRGESSDSTDMDQALWSTLFETGAWQGQRPDKRADGSSYLQQITVNTVRDEGGKITHFVGIFSKVDAL